MNDILTGVATKLRTSEAIMRFVKSPQNILVWSDVDLVPPGAMWPYILIKDGDSPTVYLRSGQREEFLNVEVYICHRSYQKQGAAQLLQGGEDGGVLWLSQTIQNLLDADVWTQWALKGFYLGQIPIQCLSVSAEPRSEPFTPRGTTVSTEWSTSRKRIEAKYYRYSVREMAV